MLRNTRIVDDKNIIAVLDYFARDNGWHDPAEVANDLGIDLASAIVAATALKNRSLLEFVRHPTNDAGGGMYRISPDGQAYLIHTKASTEPVVATERILTPERSPTHVAVTAGDVIPPPTEVASASVLRTRIRVWGQTHRAALNTLVILLPLFFTFGAIVFPGLVRLGFVVIGWLIMILAGYIAWDVVRWPDAFTTPWKSLAVTIIFCFLVWGTWRLYAPQQSTTSHPSTRVGAPAPQATTDFSGVPQTRTADAATLLRDNLVQIVHDTGVTHLRLSDALSIQLGSPLYATDWPKALAELQRQGLVKNVRPIANSFWTYQGLDGRREAFSTDYWFDASLGSGQSPTPSPVLSASPQSRPLSSQASPKRTTATSGPNVGLTSRSHASNAQPRLRTAPPVPVSIETAPATVAPTVVASATWIPKNASEVAVSTGGCEISTPTLGYVPLSQLKQQVSLDVATAALRKMLLEQVGETKTNHIDSLALVFQSQGQSLGPKNAADWVAAMADLERTGFVKNVTAWRTVMIYANVGLWERCYTDYSFDVIQH